MKTLSVLSLLALSLSAQAADLPIRLVPFTEVATCARIKQITEQVSYKIWSDGSVRYLTSQALAKAATEAKAAGGDTGVVVSSDTKTVSVVAYNCSSK